MFRNVNVSNEFILLMKLYSMKRSLNKDNIRIKDRNII